MLLLLIGTGVIAYPYVRQAWYQCQVEKRRKAFDKQVQENAYPELLEAMKAYNKQLEDNGQSGLRDAWSYQKESFSLQEWGIEDGIVGYVSIPAMDVTLPIYLGATEENMSKGAAHLSETSLPIGSYGDVSVNCVLAAHRGYAHAAMFRDIEKLRPGDLISIENLWNTIHYEVIDIKVIHPSDVDKILIQENKDLLTLITCHPYGQNSQRYCVFCSRVEENNETEDHVNPKRK